MRTAAMTMLGLVTVLGAMMQGCAQLPSTPVVTLNSETPRTTEALQAVLTTPAYDPLGEAVTYDVTWSVDGTLTEYTDLTIPAEATSKGQTWTLTVTPKAGDREGVATTASVTVVNSPPTLQGVSLTSDTPDAPAIATETSILSCTALGLSDPDTSDSPTYRTTWQVNGAEVATTETLDGGLFNKSDTVTCTVVPVDDDGAEGDPLTSTALTILNTAPALADLSITPNPAYEGDMLSVSLNAFPDIDGDAVTLAYVWSVNGEEVSRTPTLDAGYWRRDDVVTVSVVPHDGEAAGEPGVPEALTISNSAPVLTFVQLFPESPQVRDVLTASQGATDADGDAITYDYAWSVNGRVVPSETGPTLSNPETGPVTFAKTDTVSVTITPRDDADAGASATAPVRTVVNTPPVLASARIVSDESDPTQAFTDSTLTCLPGPTTDVDGDTSFTYTYAWAVGATVATSTSNTLSGSEFSKDQVVVCSATPSDGLDAGSPVASLPMAVRNSPPEVVSVEMTTDREGAPTTWNPRRDDTLGYTEPVITDADGDPTFYDYKWEVTRGGTTSAYLTTNLAKPFFEKGDTVTLTITPRDDVGFGPPAVREKTVENTPPVIQTMTFSPAIPRTADDVSVVLLDTVLEEPEQDDWDVYDPDPGDTTYTYTYAWSVDGAVVATATTDTLPATAFAKEQELEVVITPNDGTDDGPTYTATVDSVNTAPTKPSVTITPATPNDKVDLVCEVTGLSTDADGDTVTYSFTWKKNGTVYTGASTSGTKSTVSASATGLDEVWTCSVAVSDGTEGMDSDLRAVNTGTGIVQFIGEAAGDDAGYSVSSAGDVDGDGKEDLLIGAYDNADGGLFAGKAYLILGKSLGTTTSIDLAAADYSFTGKSSTDYAGYSVSSAGDVDGDGKDDVLIGAPYNGDRGIQAGKAYLILGKSLGTTSSIDLADADYSFSGKRGIERAGFSVSNAGDVDGDGKDDLLVGAPSDSGLSGSGTAYLILGKSLGTTSSIDLADADYSFSGEAASDRAGFSVSSAGDVDGDGKGDLLVGACLNDDGGSSAGKAYLILGKSLGTTTSIDLADADYSFTGEYSYDYAGYSVSSAGDVDGDGKDDLLVGAYSGGLAGKAYLILGKSLGTTTSIDLADADYSFTGEASSDMAGISVSRAGDVDGDGKEDLLIGAFRNDDGGTDAGKAYLILGKSIGTLRSIDLADADYSFTGEAAGDWAGQSVSSIGDLDGDGHPEIMVGAIGNDDGGTDAGAAYLILSSGMGL